MIIINDFKFSSVTPDELHVLATPNQDGSMRFRLVLPDGELIEEESTTLEAVFRVADMLVIPLVIKEIP